MPLNSTLSPWAAFFDLLWAELERLDATASVLNSTELPDADA